MQLNYFLGADAVNPGDVNDTDNWSTGAVPVAADFLIFSGSHSSQSLNMNMATLANVDLAGVYVSPSYSGSFGDEEHPFEFKCSSGRVILRGTGSEYNIMCAGADGVDAEIANLILDMSSGTTVRLSSFNNDAAAVHKFTHVYAYAADLTLIGDSHASPPLGSAMESGTFVENLIAVPKSAAGTSVYVMIEDVCYNVDDTAYTTLITSAGAEIVTQTQLGLLENMGAKLTDLS